MEALGARRVLVDGEERTGWWVTIDGGIVVEVGPEPPLHVDRVDLGDCDLIPGLVDLHSDCLEERARPRPTTHLPLRAALLQLDTEVISWGITTHFACVALDDAPEGERTPARAAETVAAVAFLGDATRARHLVHLRVELSSPTLDAVMTLAADPLVRLVSYMDHTPGRGQYADETEWRAYYARSATVTGAQLDATLTRRYAAQSGLAGARLAVADVAHRFGAVLASHDDDDTAAVTEAVELGARISEFPVTGEAAAAATAAGLGVVMGAPNALRGTSHLGNLSARDALIGGTLHALASDYHPPSLLRSIYALADDGVCSWADAIRLAAEGPATMIGLPDCGIVAPGRRADLVAVSRRAGAPSVEQVWIAGRPAFGAVRARVTA